MRYWNLTSLSEFKFGMLTIHQSLLHSDTKFKFSILQVVFPAIHVIFEVIIPNAVTYVNTTSKNRARKSKKGRRHGDPKTIQWRR